MTISERKPQSFFLSSPSLTMKSLPVILIVAAALLFAAAPIPPLANATATPGGGGGEQLVPPVVEEQPPVMPTMIPGGIEVSLSPLGYYIYDGGPCYSMNFSGTITDYVRNRDVTYRFIRSDGYVGPEQVIHLVQGGNQSATVTDSWKIRESYQGWAAIEILQPVQLQSNKAQFELRCTGTNSTADVQAGEITTQEEESRLNLGLGAPGQTPIEEEESEEIPLSPGSGQTPIEEEESEEIPLSPATGEGGGGSDDDDQPAQLEGRGNLGGGGSDDDDQPAQLEGRGNLGGGGSDDDEIKLN